MNPPHISNSDLLGSDGNVIITQGPALLIANGTIVPNAPDVLHSIDALVLDTNAESTDIVGSAGVVGYHSRGERIELRVIPVGYWGNLTAWFPMLSMQSGDLLLPEDDSKPFDVLCITNLKVYRFARAGVIAMSNLVGGPTVDLMQEMTLGIGRKSGVGFSDPQSFMQVFDLTKARITPVYKGVNAICQLALDATGAQWAAALNSLDGLAANGGVTVTGSYREGGLVVTWNRTGTQSDVITATLAGFPSNTVFTQTVLTHGDDCTREVRRLQVNPYMVAFTAALTPVPKCAYLISYLSKSTWTPSWGVNSGPALACDITAVDLQPVLRSLCADSNLTVSGSMREGWTVTHTPGSVPHLLTATVVDSPPGTHLKVIILTPGTPATAQVELLKLAPWAGFSHRKEWSLEWKTETQPISLLGLGTHNWEFIGLKIHFQVAPDALLLEDAISAAALQGDDTAEFGSDLSVTAQRLDIIGNGIYISLPRACFSRALQTQWGLGVEHVETLTFDGFRIVDSTGKLQPLAVLEALTPP